VHKGGRRILGEASGIDEGVYRGTDTGTAQKILSIARFLLATDGHSLPLLSTWQFSHPLPYEPLFPEL
jgi:hypothetical protein